MEVAKRLGARYPDGRYSVMHFPSARVVQPFSVASH